MNRFFVLYPGFLKKALTLSYDDGVVQDVRLMDIMDRHGIKGTFNLNSGAYDGEDMRSTRTRLTLEQAVQLYSGSGHEVAIHGRTHCFMDLLPCGVAAWEVARDRERMEESFGGIIRGMAYPMNTPGEEVTAVLKQCGIAYARTVKSTRRFELPANRLRWDCTCHHKDPQLMELCDRFLALEPKYEPKLFSVWGHSYEFEESGSWETIEAFCEKMGGREDIWYATNGEIFDYLAAAEQIRSSINGKRLYNPTAVTLYLKAVEGEQLVLLPPGQTIELM